MPVLQKEPSYFPPRLFEQIGELVESNRQWIVVHSKPRQEKCLSRSLNQAKIPFFLPLTVRHLRIRGRLMRSYRPLFEGYVFVLANPAERDLVLKTGRVVNLLKVDSQQQLSRDLRVVSQLISSGVPLTSEDRLRPGTKVVVRSGPLLGLEGTIVKEATGRRFVVQVNFLQKGASALLDDFVLVAQA